MKRYYWLKLREDFFDNINIKKLLRLPNGEKLVTLYLRLQVMSIKTEGILHYEGVEQSIESELAIKLDQAPEDVQTLVEFLQEQNLVETMGNDYLLLDVCKNIGSESDSAERVRKFREKHSQALQCNAKSEKMLQCNGGALQCNEGVTHSLSLNNTNNNIYNIEPKSLDNLDKNKERKIEKKERTPKKFTPPTLEEVEAFAKSRNSSVDPKRFYDFFTADPENAWVDSRGNPVKNWKQKFITWENKNQSERTRQDGVDAKTQYTSKDINNYRRD